MLWNRRAAMCKDTSTLLFQTAAGMSVTLSASHLGRASAHSPTPTPPPRISDCLSSFAPNLDQILRQLKTCEEFIYFHVCPVQQTGSRITLLWGCAVLLLLAARDVHSNEAKYKPISSHCLAVPSALVRRCSRHLIIRTCPSQDFFMLTV